MKIASKSGAAIAAAAATLFHERCRIEPDLRRRRGQIHRRQCLQGPECLQGRQSCLQGPERLQGSGLLRLDQGEVRRRQGKYEARLIRLPSGTGPGVGRAPFP